MNESTSNPTLDYLRGDRSREAVAVAIDYALDRMLKKGVDRNTELWPMLYEYATASEEPDPDVGIQAFVGGEIVEAEQGEFRYVRFEDCPTPSDERCQSEYHHWGRGDHVVPLDPDWVPE